MSQIERLPGLFVKVPIIFLFMFLLAPVFGQQRFGEIGDLELVSGEVLRECSVGYRTFGQIDAIRNDRRWNNGDYTENPARAFEYEVGALILTTPEYFNENTSREQVFAEIAESTDHYSGPDANNKIRQAEAMMAMDASDVSGVKAKMLIVVSKNDHTVTPGPALEFADKIGVEPFILDNICGHSLHLCADNGMNREILEFLGQ